MKRGFTLTELLFLIAVFGIIAGLAIPSVVFAAEQTQNSRVGQIGQNNNQAQVQGQSQSGVYLGDINSHNTGAELKREFVSPGTIVYPQAPQYIGPGKPSYATSMKAEKMVKYTQGKFSAKQAKKVLSGAPTLSSGKIFTAPIDEPGTICPEDHKMGVFFKFKNGRTSKGTVTVLSDDRGFISQYTFAEAILKARLMGGWDIEVEAEGFQRLIFNEGEGWGFNLTGAGMGNNQLSTLTAVAGYGHSDGWAGKFDLPWITIHALAPKTAE
ncbi:MAG: type II secretion system protein [Desulfobacteraceae bacterium]|jgi:prepilin-type N-terminal cleavage/methylation domain-containing protein